MSNVRAAFALCIGSLRMHSALRDPPLADYLFDRQFKHHTVHMLYCTSCCKEIITFQMRTRNFRILGQLKRQNRKLSSLHDIRTCDYLTGDHL